MRRRNDLSRLLTFGGRVPATVGGLVVVILASSIWAWMNRDLLGAAALMPVAIERGQVWRLFTWAIVQPDPGTLIFGGFMLVWLGMQLSFHWSERRFATRVLLYVLATGALTTIVAWLWSGGSTVAHLGVWPLVGALLVSWAMINPETMMNIWGVLPLSGRNLALLWTGGAVVYGIFSGFGQFLPHLSALALAWIQARGLGAGGGRSWRQAKRWWADRETKRRSRHLKVVKKNGSDGRSDWMH